MQEPSFLPMVRPDDPTSDDVPFLALLNSRSGSRMGAVFLDEARRFPVYQNRFFDIVHVATRPEALEAFRNQLEVVKREASQKIKCPVSGRRCRPRLICGGGDGTASFAIWIIFRALMADSRSLRWSDEELDRFFPAFVQMPLGTGNDFAGILGWGRTIDPVHHRGRVRTWIKNAVSRRLPLRPFDVWGLTPSSAGGVRACMLQGLDPEHPDRPLFKEANSSVPFLSLLYFSMGYDAFVAAQVECNRSESRMENFIEYLKTMPRSLLGKQRVCTSLEGVSIDVPAAPAGGSCSGSSSSTQGIGDTRPYFPPPHRPSTGVEFSSVGFMNINSFGGGLWKAVDPARFADGLIDCFRQKRYIKNVLRRGLRFRTEKHERATFRIPARLPGVFCQYDGETRFIFQRDEGLEAMFHVRRVMQIPVVLGPEAGYDSKADGGAKGSRCFHFIGSSEEVASFRARLIAWALGELASELNASGKEVEELQARSNAYARGRCLRSQRVPHDFGASISANACASCAVSTGNRGCKGCSKRFCKPCLGEHLGTTPNFQWAYEDGVARLLTSVWRWSSRLCFDDGIEELEALEELRPILVRVYIGYRVEDERRFASPEAALDWMKIFRSQDAEDHEGDQLLRPFDQPTAEKQPNGSDSECSDEEISDQEGAACKTWLAKGSSSGSGMWRKSASVGHFRWGQPFGQCQLQSSEDLRTSSLLRG
eukprot:TRINITY_DN20189_c0_g1_i2.p1 TRINITY_DN20189_c0_g1~~TRINITY_DN20189_c0_g1_i2.p1  ORF type:complete len:709 (-),score=122.81 TRINITY_DN20189_c0_g1_i2:9-2135(-)